MMIPNWIFQSWMHICTPAPALYLKVVWVWMERNRLQLNPNKTKCLWLFVLPRLNFTVGLS